MAYLENECIFTGVVGAAHQSGTINPLVCVCVCVALTRIFTARGARYRSRQRRKRSRQKRGNAGTARRLPCRAGRNECLRRHGVSLSCSHSAICNGHTTYMYIKS